MKDFNSALYQIIGERIKNKRNQLGISQEKLSIKADIGRTSISNIEIGRHQPPLHVLYKISRALEYDIQSLLPTITEISQRQKKENNLNEDFIKIISKIDVNKYQKINIEDIIKKLDNDT